MLINVGSRKIWRKAGEIRGEFDTSLLRIGLIGQDNLRTLFNTYAQFLMEAKNIEEGMDGESLEFFEMLPLLESTAALLIGGYNMRPKGA